MSTDQRLQSHVLRRELHSPKSGLAITLAVIAVVALAWVGTESVVAALSRPALLLSPAAMASDVRALSSVQQGVLIAGGAVVAIIGLVLVIASLTAGRRGRHVIDAEDTAAVVNDEVIGSALVRAAAQAAGISPDRAVATVGRTSATVRITPASGVPVDRAAIQSAVASAADGFGLSPRIRTRVAVETKGRIG
jgi:phosphatidylglycerophosphatase A